MDRCPRIRSDTLAQAVRLGEVVTQNPLHQGPAIPEAPPALSMLNSLLSAGEPLALGSDAGPNEAKPILNIMVASTCESSPNGHDHQSRATSKVGASTTSQEWRE